jgi:hypothetical protein
MTIQARADGLADDFGNFGPARVASEDVDMKHPLSVPVQSRLNPGDGWRRVE